MFRKIEQIKIGAQKAGEAFGGQIFSVSATIGGNGQATSLDINVVSKDGRYEIDKSNLSATKPVAISIGDDETGLVFKKMYLISYNISKSSNAKVLHLQYKDHTIFFNKVFVGQINAHGNPASLLEDGEEGKIRKNFEPGKEFNIKLPLQCAPCSKTDVDPETGLKPIQVIDKTFYSDAGFVTNVHPIKGGVILLGTEEYTTNDCQLADVKYSFNELLHVLSEIGIEVKVDSDSKQPTLHDRGKPHKREKHSGTLTEVLNSWCSELGFSWYWDWEEEKLAGVDNLSPQADLVSIKNKINNLNEDSNIIVTDSDESFSLEGTYTQEGHSFVRKDARTADQSRTTYAGCHFVSALLYEVMGPEFFGGGRNLDELITSASLSKFNKDLRRLYNWGIIGSKLNGNLAADNDSLEHLGINAYYKLNSDEATLIFGMDKGIGDIKSNFPGYSDVYGENADIYFVNYSEDLLRRWEKWEEDVADFIGKYYVTRGLMPDGMECAPSYQVGSKITTEPKSERFSSASSSNVPWKSVLEKHPDGALSTVDAQNYTVRQITGHSIINFGSAALARGGSYRFYQDDPSNTIPFKFYEDPQLSIPVTEGFIIKGKPGQEGASSEWLVPEKYSANTVYYHAPQGVIAINIVDKPEIGSGDLMFIHERSTAWGTTQKDVDELVTDIATGSSKLKPLVPQYEPIAGFAYGGLLVRLEEEEGLAELKAAYDKNQKQEYESCIVVVPRLNVLTTRVHVGEIKGNTVDGFGGTINSKETGLYKTHVDQLVEKVTGKGQASSCSSILDCESTLFEEFCRCIGNVDMEVKPSGTGLLSNLARYFTVTVDGNSLNIVLPVESLIRGFYEIQRIIKYTLPGVEQHFGKHLNAGEAMEYIVTHNDITSMIDELKVDRNDAPAGKSTNYEKVDNLPGVPGSGGGKVISGVPVPNNSWEEGDVTFTAISAEEYHKITAYDISSDEPSEAFKFTIAGLDYTDIKKFLSPSEGMDSFTLNYGIDGVTTNLSFSNGRLRAEAVKIQRDLSLKHLEPKISLNRFGRTF